MTAGQLKGAVDDYEGIRAKLIDAQGISGALNSVIGLQGSYSAAIQQTGSVQNSATNSIVQDLQLEYSAKQSLLEIERSLQEAKVATMKADLEASKAAMAKDMSKLQQRPDLVAQGYEDPRVGRLTQIPGEIGGYEATLEFMRTNENARAVQKQTAELTLAELALKAYDSAMNKTFAGSAVQQGLNNLNNLSNLTKVTGSGLSSLATTAGATFTAANQNIEAFNTVTQTANTNVANVTAALARARMQTLQSIQQASSQITTMEKGTGGR